MYYIYFLSIICYTLRDGWYCTKCETTPLRGNNLKNPALYSSIALIKEGDSMKIGFVGAGKVGFSLGKFFSEGGIKITGYYSKNLENSKEAAKFTNSRYYESLKDLIKDCDAIFITVPDNLIETVYKQICEFEIKNKTICHCSGSISSNDIFKDIHKYNAKSISIHPLFPISDKYNTYRELTGAFFCLEGDNEPLIYFKSILEALGANVQIIDSDVKNRYHAACVFSSNLVCALAQTSISLLRECGFSEDTALKAISPLMKSNIEHIIKDGPISALTGPIERNDTSTVKKHLETLNDNLSINTYCDLSKKLIEISTIKHPNIDYSELLNLLNLEGNI